MRRATLIALTGLVLGVPTTCLGAPPLPCNMVTDPAGDVLPPNADINDPRKPESTDLLSGDLASNRAYLTATIRVKHLSGWTIESPGGVSFDFNFTLGKSRYSLAAHRSNVQTAFTLWHMTDGGTDRETWGYITAVAGVFDDDRSEIRITTPLKRLFLAPTDKVATTLRLESDMTADGGFVYTGSSVDMASSKGSYRLGSPSCGVINR